MEIRTLNDLLELVVLRQFRRFLDSTPAFYTLLHVVNGFLGHSVDGLLEEAWHTQLEFHQIAREHHQVLHKCLELHQIGLRILHLPAAMADTLIHLLKKLIVHLIHFLQHLPAASFLAHSKAPLLSRHFQCHLKGAQVGQCIEIRNMKCIGQFGLKIHTDEHHEIFHSTDSHFIVGLFTAKNLS